MTIRGRIYRDTHDAADVEERKRDIEQRLEALRQRDVPSEMEREAIRHDLKSLMHKLDFSVPTDKAVFYTDSRHGFGAAAEAHCAQNGSFTIERTRDGNWLDKLNLHDDRSLGPERAVLVFKDASACFSASAKGEFHAFVPQKPSPERAFAEVELPTLDANEQVMRGHFHHNPDNPERERFTTREKPFQQERNLEQNSTWSHTKSPMEAYDEVKRERNPEPERAWSHNKSPAAAYDEVKRGQDLEQKSARSHSNSLTDVPDKTQKADSSLSQSQDAGRNPHQDREGPSRSKS